MLWVKFMWRGTTWRTPGLGILHRCANSIVAKNHGSRQLLAAEAGLGCLTAMVQWSELML